MSVDDWNGRKRFRPILLGLMRLTHFLALLLFAGICHGTEAPSNGLEVSQFVSAPVGSAYVACLDGSAGTSRLILMVDPSLQKPVFYRQTSPRSTEVHWSPDARRCVIADAPTNAGPDMWLLAHSKNRGWTIRKFDPFSRLDQAYYQHDWNGRTVNRDGFEGFRWLDNRRFAFVIVHNLGNYHAEIDSVSETLNPTLHKLP